MRERRKEGNTVERVSEALTWPEVTDPYDIVIFKKSREIEQTKSEKGCRELDCKEAMRLESMSARFAAHSGVPRS